MKLRMNPMTVVIFNLLVSNLLLFYSAYWTIYPFHKPSFLSRKKQHLSRTDNAALLPAAPVDSPQCLWAWMLALGQITARCA
jgi:hypothetical protein